MQVYTVIGSLNETEPPAADGEGGNREAGPESVDEAGGQPSAVGRGSVEASSGVTPLAAIDDGAATVTQATAADSDKQVQRIGYE